MSARQLELLDKPKRKTRGQLMHVCDADGGCGGPSRGPVRVCLRCVKCDYETDWTEFPTVTEARRGLPCPRCNH